MDESKNLQFGPYVLSDPQPGRFIWLIHGQEVLAFEPDGTVSVRGQKVDDNHAIYEQVRSFFLVTAAGSGSQRLLDLVRHQRGALHDAGLITDTEYADLAADPGAVARLEGYDLLRNAATTFVAHMGDQAMLSLGGQYTLRKTGHFQVLEAALAGRRL